jgi:peptide/nickel transport system ATP-binding protein
MPGVSALESMPGCRFAARCPQRMAACEAEPPASIESSPGHWVRCLRPRDILPCVPIAADASEATSADRTTWHAPTGDTSAEPLIELQDVTLRYTARRGLLGQRKVHNFAVDGLCLKVQPGEFVGIVGESGSGKSSVAKLIVGSEVRRLNREHVQMIFQDPHSALNPRRSVYRLLTQTYEADRRAVALAEHPREERAQELLTDVGLPKDTLTRFPSQLSGGQKQRVNIGRALCVMPRLIVADEIVSGLDVSVQAQILNLLIELGRKHGIALVLISHDLSVVRYLCSRIVVMQRGKVVEQGKTEEVFSDPQHPYTRLLLSSVPPADPSIAWPPAISAAN